MRHGRWLSLALLTLPAIAIAAGPSREEILARMQPYRGELVQGVDVSTLTGTGGRLLRGEISPTEEMPHRNEPQK